MKRPDLATVRVAGDLQSHSSGRGHPDLLGLMRQQNNGNIRINTVQCGGQIGPMAVQSGRNTGRIIDTRKDHLIAATLHHPVPIVHGFPAKAGHVIEPTLGLAEILVVPGDVELDATNIPQRLDLGSTLLNRAVSQITHVANDIRPKLIDGVDQPSGPPLPVDRPEMRVGENGDTKPVRPPAQPGNDNVNRPNPRQPHGLEIPGQNKKNDNTQNNKSHNPSRRETIHTRQHENQSNNLADNRPGETNPDHTKSRVTNPGRDVAMPAPMPSHHQQREPGHAQTEHHGADDEHGQGPARSKDERPPTNPEQQQENRNKHKGKNPTTTHPPSLPADRQAPANAAPTPTRPPRDANAPICRRRGPGRNGDAAIRRCSRAASRQPHEPV